MHGGLFLLYISIHPKRGISGISLQKYPPSSKVNRWSGLCKNEGRLFRHHFWWPLECRRMVAVKSRVKHMQITCTHFVCACQERDINWWWQLSTTISLACTQVATVAVFNAVTWVVNTSPRSKSNYYPRDLGMGKVVDERIHLRVPRMTTVLWRRVVEQLQRGMWIHVMMRSINRHYMWSHIGANACRK